jgi:hypothetical protein
MTNEEMQKAMEFVVNQQAQFAVDIQKLQEAQWQFAADIQKLQEAQAESAQILNRLAAVTVKGFEDTNAKINALIDAQIHTDENLNKTNDDLRALIAVVNRHYGDGRNGR